MSPLLDVEPAGADATPERGVVRVAWRITNLTAELVEVLETWLPHGRFFAPREAFEPPLVLGAGARQIVGRDVRSAAEPGEVVENAFLNLRVRTGGSLRRVLARMRVEYGVEGSVHLAVEAVTVQPVGFAGAAEERQR